MLSRSLDSKVSYLIYLSANKLKLKIPPVFLKFMAKYFSGVWLLRSIALLYTAYELLLVFKVFVVLDI